MKSTDIAVTAFVLAVLITGFQPQEDSLGIWLQGCFMFAGAAWMIAEAFGMIKRFYKYVMTDHGEYKD